MCDHGLAESSGLYHHRVVTWFCIFGSSKCDSDVAVPCRFKRTRLKEEKALHRLWLPFPLPFPARLALHRLLSMDVLLCIYTDNSRNMSTTVCFVTQRLIREICNRKPSYQRNRAMESTRCGTRRF